MTADELMALKEEGEEKKVSDAFAEANCKSMVWRCRARMDNFQDQQRVRYQVASAAPMSFPVEAAKLAELIKQYDLNSDSLFVR
ncbi:hypothetical protein LTR28_000797 [Elasticomyces elasticus]|nr:hypothetical protein LTR28_000797 [Elasticomyces elasticus]